MSKAFRKFVFWTHLSLGLLTALMVMVMCVTGVLAAYRGQLESLLNHWGASSKPPSPRAQPLPLEALAAKVRANAGSTPRALTVFSNPSMPVEFHLGWGGGTVYADAYTGAIIGRPSPAVFRFFGQVNAWHGSMGVNGPNQAMATAIMDAANLICLYLIVFGLYLWLPRQWTWRHLKAVLLFRPGLSGKARDFNWHNVIGFWSLIPLAVMVWTGVAISYPWAAQATARALGSLPQAGRSQSGIAEAADPFAEPDPFDARTSGLSSLLDQAKQRLPGWRSIRLEIPVTVASPVNFTLDPLGYEEVKGGRSYRLQLARTGEELSFVSPGPIRGRGLYRFAHTGELWGFWGQTVAMLGCLGGVFLVWTGVSLSLRRYASWRARKAC